MSKKNNYQLKILSADEYQLWDAFVSQSPQQTLFHTSYWASLIKQVFNRDFKILVLLKKDQIAAGIMFWPKKVLFIEAVTHIPNTTYQGPLYRSSNASKASSMQSEYEDHTTRLLEYLVSRYQIIDIPLSPAIKDTRPYTWKNFKVENAYTYRFEITDFEQLKLQFSQDLRRKIKKSNEQDISFKKSVDSEYLSRFILDSYKESANAPAISSSLIKKFMDTTIKAGCGSLYYQYLDEEPVGGIFVLQDESTVYALFSGISAKKRDITNNELVHVYVLRQTELLGKKFDFLGANTRHLEQFKRSFGGELIPFFKVSFKSNNAISSLFYARSKYHLAIRKFKSFY
jgi:Acetyltransferase (GNAT) domain